MSELAGGRFGPDFIPPGFLHQPFASLALPVSDSNNKSSKAEATAH